MYIYDTEELIQYVRDNEGKAYTIRSCVAEDQLFPIYEILENQNQLSND